MTVTLCLFPEGGDAVVTLQDFNVEAEVSFGARSLVCTGIQTRPEQNLGSGAPLTELVDIILGTLGVLDCPDLSCLAFSLPLVGLRPSYRVRAG